MKKFLAFFLAFALMFSWMPVPASAETAEVASGYPCDDGHHVPETNNWGNETGVCQYCGIPCRTSGTTIWAIEEDGTMIIYGTGENGAGELYAYSTEWTEYADQVTALVIEEGVTGGIFSFTMFEKLVSVSLPEGITEIANDTFGGCINLEQVNFPESLTRLGSNSFHGCVKLTEVHLPAALVEFGARPFGGCTSLTGIWVDAKNPSYANDQYGVLFSKDMTQLLEVPCKLSGVYVIPETVNYIEWAAFDGCKLLTGVEIPNGVTWLQMNLFENCTSLKSITIPASVTYLWINVFKGCTALESIFFEGDAPDMSNAFLNLTTTAYYPAENETWTEDKLQNYGGTITWVAYEVPAEVVAEGTCGDNLTWVLTDDGVLTISGEGAMTDYLYTVTNAPWYSKRAQIQSVVVKEGVTSLGDYAFYGCDSLAEIALPESLESIGDVALASTALTVVNIPAAVTSIGGEVFEGISELTAINVSEENAVYSSDENGVLFNKDKTQLLRCPLSYAGAYVIPDTVQVVGHKAFDHCTALTQVTVPGSVTELSRHAFFACTGLKSVILAEGLQEIGDEVFSLCSALSGSLTIPSTLTTLGDSAFDMTELTEIRFLGDMPAIGEFAFSGIALTVYYPADNETWTAEKIEACKGISTWAPYGISIVEQPQNAQAQLNKLAKTTVEATGEGLTYTWYVKDVGGSFVKSSIKTAIYSYVMTEAKAGRQVYCVVTDEEGNSVTTRTVTFGLAATMVKQPQDVSVAEGEIATVSFDAVGDGLTYKWYFKNADASKFLYTSTFSGDTYTATMNDTRNGRQIYCVITDQYGNSVQTNTVTLSMTGGLKITRQPESVTVAEGGTVKIDFAVAGEGLTYKWYFKNAGASKFTYTSTFSGNTYTTTMNDARNGRQVYCVVTDKYGNTVKTNTVTMTMASALKITRQPESVTVAEGKTAKISFTAVGDGLTYKWYYKNAGDSKFSYTATFTGNTYSATMNDARNGRQVYCVVTDKYGNTVKTNTVTMTMASALKITRQPESVTVAEGGTVKIDFTVSGDGLIYKWYYKNAGDSKFSYTATFSGNTYTTTMNDARNGRQVYCVVTDKYGNTVKTNTVTMTMASVLKITRQPESVTVAEGGTVTIDFAVSGDGLTYKWYFKNAGDSKFSYTATFSGNTYTTTMNDVRNGRQIYCVITDQYGNSVQTNTVTMRMSE